MSGQNFSFKIQDNNVNYNIFSSTIDQITADDGSTPFEMTGTITSEAEMGILNTALSQVDGGGLEVTVDSTYSLISGLTNASTSDNITFTVSDSLTPEQLVAIAVSYTHLTLPTICSV